MSGTTDRWRMLIATVDQLSMAVGAIAHAVGSLQQGIASIAVDRGRVDSAGFHLTVADGALRAARSLLQPIADEASGVTKGAGGSSEPGGDR